MKSFLIHAKVVSCVSLLLFSPLASVFAADEQIKDASLSIVKVALFKNGMGFLQSEATLPDNASTVRLGQLPVPVYGTFWVGYGKDVAVKSLITSLEDVMEPATVQIMSQLLQQNAGRKAVLRTEKEVVEGTIVKSPDTKMPEAPGAYFMDVRRIQDSSGRYYYGNSGYEAKVVLVKTDKGMVALNANAVLRADFEGGDIDATLDQKLKRPVIRLELEKPAGGKKLGISCLAHGVTWVPSYLIDLTDPKTAKLSAKAVIMNELADFSKIELELVTGYPNIKFGDIQSPVAMTRNLEEFMNALTAGRDERRRDMTQQRAIMSNVAVFNSEMIPAPAYSTAVEGAGAEDLFFYPVKDFTLKKGETATIPLFSAEMPYQHIYTWMIMDWLDDNGNYRSNRQQNDRPDGKIAEEVWHCCRLINNLKMPLTTAAAEFVTDGRFTGQDVCYFTAPGTDTTIHINRAMNVLADQNEIEVERKRDAARFYGSSYDLVKVRGELKVSNRLDKPVPIEITKELSGEVLEKKPEAKDVQTAKGLKQVNPKHLLTWQLEIKPGEEQKFSYSYQVYIRN